MKIPKWSLMNRNQKIASFLAVGLVLSGVYLHFQSTTKVSYYEVGKQTVEKLVNLKAQTLPKTHKWYEAPSSGVITELGYEMGSVVDSGVVLGSLKTFDFESKQKAFDEHITQFVAKYAKVVETDNTERLDEKLKPYVEVKTKLGQAIEGHVSVLALFNDQMISETSYRDSLKQISSVLPQYVDASKQLLTDLEALYQSNEGAKKDLEVLDSELEPLYGIKLLLAPKQDDGKTDEVKTDVVAPIEIKVAEKGTLTRRIPELNLYVPKSAKLFEVSDVSRVLAQMEMPVEDLANVKIGTEVRTKDQSGKVIIGKLIGIDNTITEQMISDGSIVKSVKVTAEFEANAQIPVYSTQSVSVVALKAKDAVVVPEDLVSEKDSKHYVWVNVNGILTEKEIKVKFEVDGLVVVDSGLNAGDKLVMDTKLKLGQKIKF